MSGEGDLSLNQLEMEPRRIEEEIHKIDADLLTIAKDCHVIYPKVNGALQEVITALHQFQVDYDEMMREEGDKEDWLQLQYQIEDMMNQRKALKAMQVHMEPIAEILSSPKRMKLAIQAQDYDLFFTLRSSWYALLDRSKGFLQYPKGQALHEEVLREETVFIQSCVRGLRRKDQNLVDVLGIVSNLRRLEVYSEVQLQVMLLSQKNYMSVTIFKVDYGNRSAYTYLSKLMDQLRPFLMDVYNQYFAIFQDGEDQWAYWVMGQMQQFLKEMERSMERITNGASLASIMKQLYQFSVYVAKLGLDIYPHLHGIMMKSMERLIGHHRDQAMESMHRMLGGKHIQVMKGEGEDRIAQFPLLQDMMSRWVKCLNELRGLVSSGFIPKGCFLLGDWIVAWEKGFATHALFKYYSDEKSDFNDMIRCFYGDVVPFLQSTAATLLRISSDAFPSLQNIHKVGL